MVFLASLSLLFIEGCRPVTVVPGAVGELPWRGGSTCATPKKITPPEALQLVERGADIYQDH